LLIDPRLPDIQVGRHFTQKCLERKWVKGAGVFTQNGSRRIWVRKASVKRQAQFTQNGFERKWVKRGGMFLPKSALSANG